MTEEKNTTPLHGSNVAREQIPTACKWHISDIYAGENDWQAACEEYKSKLPQLQAEYCSRSLCSLKAAGRVGKAAG